MDSPLQAWWEDFRAHVPVDASEVYVGFMRLAFYVGVSDGLRFIGTLPKTEANRRVLVKLTDDVNAGLSEIAATIERVAGRRAADPDAARAVVMAVESRVGVSAIRASWEPTSDSAVASKRWADLRLAVAGALLGELLSIDPRDHAGILVEFADYWGPE